MPSETETRAADALLRNEPDAERLMKPDEESSDEKDIASLIEPAVGRLAVLVKEIPERSPSGLYIPSGAKKEMDIAYRPTQGKVVAVANPEEDWKDADGEVWRPLYQVGDTVLFGKYAGVKVSFKQQTVIILDEANIIARVKDPTAKLKVKE
jgi:chaperonin GroES